MTAEKTNNKRQIKFRVYDQSFNIMYTNIYNLYIDIDKGIVTGVHSKKKNACTYIPINGSERYVVMQYTGLKDKEGKEIYEGDVVEIIHPCWSNQCIVKFSNGSFIFLSEENATPNQIVTTWSFMREKWQIKVIGNIYENPEILTNE